MKAPQKISGYRSRPINGLIDYAQSITPTESRSIAVTRKPSGLGLEVKGYPPAPHERMFDVYQTANDTVEVRAGLWVRELCVHSRTNIGLWITADGATSTNWETKSEPISGITQAGYIILTLDHAWTPTKATASFTATIPAGADNGKVYVLAYIFYGSTAINGVVPIHQGGTIQQLYFITDTDEPLTTSKSIEFRQSDHAAQVYGFELGTTVTPDAGSHIMLRYGSPRQVDYVNATDFASWIQDDLWADAGFIASADGWLSGATVPPHAHTSHSAFNSDDHNVASTVPYLLLNANGDETRNSCHANVRIGDSANEASINPDGRILYDDDGETGVMCWDLDGWYLAWSEANVWSAATLAVDVTGAISLTAGAASTWTFTDSLTINAAGIELYGTGSDSLYLGGAAGLAHSNIYYNGVDGVDIANWTTKGGLTGTGVTAMTIQVPDGSGGTKDIEVLARAL